MGYTAVGGAVLPHLAGAAFRDAEPAKDMVDALAVTPGTKKLLRTASLTIGSSSIRFKTTRRSRSFSLSRSVRRRREGSLWSGGDRR